MNAFLTKILLATDGSTDATLAARVAADVSKGTGSELHVVHVLRQFPQHAYPGITPELYSYVLDETYGEAHHLLDEQAERIAAHGATVSEIHVRRGSVPDEILDLAQEIGAGLILMGSRGLGPVRRLLLGSVAEGVVHHAPCPVLVARGGQEAWPPERVVIGDDGSEAAEGAGRLGTFIGGLFETKALLVRTYPELPELDVEGRKSNPRLVDDEFKREWRRLEERAIRIGESSGARPLVRLSVGDPAACLLEAGEEEGVPEKTLITVGSRGLGTMRRLRLGSVSTKVLRVARGPVLVCPPGRGTKKDKDEGGSEVGCKERLQGYLGQNGVPFEVQHHPRVITAQEVAATEHVPGKMFAKTVIALADEEMVMLVLPAPYHINPEKAAEALGARDFRLASEEQFEDAFSDCEVGAMPPFGNLYDVPVYVDEAFRG